MIAQESLKEWQKIRDEQDQAYEESLAIDREKVILVQLKTTSMIFVLNVQVIEAEVGERKTSLLRELRGQLGKDYGADGAADGISVSFRFKYGKVDHTFPSTSSVKVHAV